MRSDRPERFPSAGPVADAEGRFGTWPGNVRELAGRVQGGRVRTLAEFERDHIQAVLAMTGWRVSGERGAAKVLGLKPTSVEARMKKLGIARNA
jgi:transcriptional regulator with GAF, ATPase, and Fis domain